MHNTEVCDKVLCRKVRPLHNCCTMSERPTKHDNYKTLSCTLVINDYKITLTRVRLDLTKHNRHNLPNLIDPAKGPQSDRFRMALLTYGASDGDGHTFLVV